MGVRGKRALNLASHGKPFIASRFKHRVTCLLTTQLEYRGYYPHHPLHLLFWFRVLSAAPLSRCLAGGSGTFLLISVTYRLKPLQFRFRMFGIPLTHFPRMMPQSSCRRNLHTFIPDFLLNKAELRFPLTYCCTQYSNVFSSSF